ncbi:hypothetical protein C823_000381 [Eubacterium plexicaudatum ASF492]|uniref:Uncharacterized protein n=1 Tax=Eubacterium plexicaudatum ASF492 TaxID=1235802 RepID=N2A1G3_9FIRM|nr:hypothetical protein C823_000381 [Eubacterium plexicaudatum ASF492]
MGYVDRMRDKSPTKWGVQMAGMNFKTHSKIYILKYVNEKSGASKDDVYNALLAKNKTNELLQICTA